MRKRAIATTGVFCSIFCVVFCCVSATIFVRAEEPTISPNLFSPRESLRTTYQQAGRYDARYDLKTDAVMVYGVDDATVAGYSEWAEKSGSVLQVMTGIAWGEYQDYLDGKFDGTDHWDDAQVNAKGDQVLHGPRVPYICPSVAFADFMIARLKKVVDAGVTTIYLEEPEFWAFSGWGESFKRQWRMYYGTDWIAPDSSPDAQYRASLLKAHLYRRALETVGTALKEYSLQKYGRPLAFFVPTHSLISYAQIRMVSPEATLLDLPAVDGLIAQIWTGTARQANIYRGVERERTFESAFLEYNVTQEMVRGTSKRIYFLNDPVEDDPNYDWDDYRRNYLATLTASLLQPGVADFEVAPWPSRVFLGKYKPGPSSLSVEATDLSVTPEKVAKKTSEKTDLVTIPTDYASILLAGFHQLRDMNQADIDWNGATGGIGVLLSDSAMFQRGTDKFWKLPTGIDATDPEGLRPYTTEREYGRLNGFFSLCLPLIKVGVPVGVPVLDHLTRFPGYLDPYRVLVLSYEFQKPLAAGIHAELADWVRRGGVLVYVGAETDPFHKTEAWWNTGNANFATPTEHLLAGFGLPRNAPSGEFRFGEGSILVDRSSPAHYGRSDAAADEYRQRIDRAATLAGIGEIARRNYLLLNRGPYLLAACLEESVSDEPLTLAGHFLDLFDAKLPVLHDVTLLPGTQKWLLDLNRVKGTGPIPLVCGGRLADWSVANGTVSFTTASPVGVNLIARIRLDAAPTKITLEGEEVTTWNWDEPSKTLFLTYPVESAEPVAVAID